MSKERFKIMFASIFTFVLILCFFGGCGQDKDNDNDGIYFIEGKTGLIGEGLVNWYGRTKATDSLVASDNVTSGFEVGFFGTELIADLSGQSGAYLSVFLDGDTDCETNVIKELNSRKTVTLVSKLSEGAHTVKVLKRSEAADALCSLYSLKTDGRFVDPLEMPARKMEIYGDSITAGYGNLGNNSGTKTNENSNGLYTYSFLAAQNLNAQINTIAYSGYGLYTSRWSAGLIPSIYQCISGGDGTLWDFNSYQADVVMINLGTNDYANLGGANAAMPFFNAQSFKTAYKTFIGNLREKYPHASIVCIYGMMDNSAVMTGAISSTVTEINNDGDTNVHYLNLPQADNSGVGGHPSAAAHLIASAALTEELKELMNW